MAWKFFTAAGQEKQIVAPANSTATIFDVVVARGQAGDPATAATVIDSNTILGGNIPSLYKHLKLICSVRGNSAGINDSMFIRFNADSAANYDAIWAYVQAAVMSQGSSVGATQAFVGYPAGDIASAGWGSVEINILDYNDTVRRKAIATKFGFMGESAANSISGFGNSEWRSTSPITRLQLYLATPGTTQFKDGSRITLLGIF